jgi:hypothetical protein
MKTAILAALALGAAPALAQSNLGNSSKDQATSDAQRSKEDSKSTASSSSDSATPQSSTSIGDSGATADSSASAPASRSVDEVRKDKKKGIARARAAKRQRETNGAERRDPRSPSNNTAPAGDLKTDDHSSPSSTGTTDQSSSGSSSPGSTPVTDSTSK